MMLQLAALLLAQASVTLPPAEGRHLFEVHCASCHGLSLEGSDQAPPLVNVDAQSVDFELRTGRMPARVPFEQEYAKRPIFAPPEMAALESYVLSRSDGQKTLPAVNVQTLAQTPAAVLRKGRAVYEENCEQCHAGTGRGNGVGYRDVAPELTDADPQTIADAVRMGPDVMPRFGTGTIDDANLSALVAYVQYLQKGQYNPGGLPLANWGPISEGFIAWTVGMGLLVLFIRRIGEA